MAECAPRGEASNVCNVQSATETVENTTIAMAMADRSRRASSPMSQDNIHEAGTSMEVEQGSRQDDSMHCTLVQKGRVDVSMQA